MLRFAAIWACSVVAGLALYVALTHPAETWTAYSVLVGYAAAYCCGWSVRATR